MKSKKKKVVVLGGGLAGLACADELLRKGKGRFEVLVLEKNDHLGGLAATYRKDGFLFDLAPHRWFTKNEELNKWIDKLMGKEMIWVEKNTPMYQFGKFFNYPVEVFDVLKKIDPLKMVAMLSSYVWARITNRLFARKPITLRDAYIDKFGYVLYKWFNEEYNNKIWGERGCEEMSADWFDQRVKTLSMVTMIKNALGFGGEVISLIPTFRFPKLGISRISDNLEERIKENGGEVLKRILIKKIIKQKSGYQVVTNKGNFQAEEAVSSIPIDELVNLLEPKVPVVISKALDKLSYIHQRIVVLLARKHRLTPFLWVYIHPPKIKAFRFLETNNWSEVMSPKGKTSLVFEYPYQVGDELERMKDKELIDLSIADFSRYFSPETKRSDFIKGYVFEMRNAYPKYDLFYAKPLGTIKSYLRKSFKGLQLIGRSGMFRYNNMDHSILTGMLAARNIVAGKMIYDPEQVNNEAEYIEEKKVE